MTGSWVEWFATAMLLVTTAFSYSYGQYTTAVVAGVCAGFIGGVSIARLVYERRR